ncbi:transmembrane protein 216 isoform X2 [Augochlora pura]
MPTIATSSLTYEILMYLNSFYFGMFAVCELGMGFFKAANLPSPGTSTTLTEFALLFFLIVTEGARIYLGRKGNLTEHGLPILIGVVLTVPSSLATLYFLIWQNYVLRLELFIDRHLPKSKPMLDSVLCLLYECNIKFNITEF